MPAGCWSLAWLFAVDTTFTPAEASACTMADGALNKSSRATAFVLSVTGVSRFTTPTSAVRSTSAMGPKTWSQPSWLSEGARPPSGGGAPVRACSLATSFTSPWGITSPPNTSSTRVGAEAQSRGNSSRTEADTPPP